MVTCWTRRLACAALIVGFSLAGSTSSVGAQPARPPSPPAPASPTTIPTLTSGQTAPATTSRSTTAQTVATPIVAPVPFGNEVPCATDDPSNERVQRSEPHRDDNGIGNDEGLRTGNGRNEVIVHNCTDNRLRVRAAIQLNTIRGRVVHPLNEAFAEGSCLQCQTLTVALQIDLYLAEKANDIEPQNFAIAINSQCTRCVTVARAIQFVHAEDDPRDVAENIDASVDALDKELTAIQTDRSVTLAEAESRLNAVIARFNALGGSLNDQRAERHG